MKPVSKRHNHQKIMVLYSYNYTLCTILAQTWHPSHPFRSTPTPQPNQTHFWGWGSVALNRTQCNFFYR